MGPMHFGLTTGYRGTADFASLYYYQQQIDVDGY